MTIVVGTGCLAAQGFGPDALRNEAGGPEPKGLAAAIEGFDPADYLRMRGLRPLARATALAAVAADAALGEAPPDVASERVGTVVGTQWGSIEPLVEFDRTATVDGPGLVNPSHFPNVVANVHAAYLGILFGLRGPNVTICGAAAGLEAIGRGADLIALGRADAVVAGGTEALGTTLLRGLERAGKTEAGHPQGEGAGFLLLTREPLPDRPSLARVAGWASRTAHTKSDVDDARCTAVAAALARADLAAVEVDLVWAGDEWPNGALQSDHAVRSIRDMCGECRAAGGALAAVLAVAAVAEGDDAVLVVAFPPRGTQAALVLTRL